MQNGHPQSAGPPGALWEPAETEATCVTEMSVMMACWKKNEFRDEACRKEIRDFLDCAARAQEAGKMKALQDTLGDSRSLLPHKMNKLLQRFPNKPHLS
ncbi:coiled-coil-helix-coiled-coil-helix domain-containing protein 1 isoform X2 [Dipodomys spectabilis]|uniref:coiled-coil-helix-coiled-coil-helix domain-containing protein 1 isoform X2 n=1 Tax=Dipodomys spectabilis TaxID=105255 RepID=UPI001C53D9C7|nr:coiled-coil-helix-coiled-coil-helix domain-containing protein 1 isoform X2 [Dipodomys spectabilis]